MARRMDIQYVNFYSAGSEAVKFEPKPMAKKAEVKLPKPRRKKHILIHVDPLAIMGICVASLLLVCMVVGAIQLRSAQQEAAQMQSYVQTLQARNDALRQTYEAGYDLEEIRQIALTRGMIPIEQAEHVYIQVTTPEVPEEPTAWESFVTFLTGLFA